MNQRSRECEPQFFCLSPAARGRGGRFPGEVPVFARGDSRLPAGQEGRGQRSQQVAVIDATRGSIGGGLRLKKKPCKGVTEPLRKKNRETESKLTVAKREVRRARTKEGRVRVEIIKTVNFIFKGQTL